MFIIFLLNSRYYVDVVPGPVWDAFWNIDAFSGTGQCVSDTEDCTESQIQQANAFYQGAARLGLSQVPF
ncbi:hypothetical protein [Sinobaca sp. H24]|uniref:hypothetical protein n=1 Tax=Sinobaca sp. H24 TaxID=2923376 RepID=UPI00207A87C1|nr:hypothetical protein [Sinobaca sp. H24]